MTRRLIVLVLLCFWLLPAKVLAAPSITSISDNRNAYTNNQVPQYGKFEVSFQVNNSAAANNFFPYEAAPPAGLPAGTGITVDAYFTDPGGVTYKQPAFYYQQFDDQVKNNQEWFYPLNTYQWKVRFAPDKVGTWTYRIEVADAGGNNSTGNQTFVVAGPQTHGFINVSAQDKRYFEHDDGTYFPALGYNLNGGELDNINPTLGNTSEFSNMGSNGIQLSRIWVSQFSIYGEGWGKWGDHNPAHFTHQEPRNGIVNPLNWEIASWYPSFTPPTPPAGSEYYLWLNYDTYLETDPAAHNLYPRFTPCRYFNNVPLKQNTSYRVKVRYKDYNLEGPKVAGQPFGFTVKRSPEGLYNAAETIEEISKCNDPTRGTVLAATYTPGAVSPDPTNPGWSILEGTFANTTSDFMGYLYLTFNNVADTTGDNQAGKVFIDRVWLEESGCTTNCPNLIHKPWMSMHYYINQRDAHAFDKVLNLAETHGLYLKAVMMEKNDRIMQTIGFDGQPFATQSIDNFYGNGTTVTKVRWLQQAWWRYMQARWGYSPNIHSWELLNEGGPTTNHFVLADEFGKYMHCRLFSQQPINDPELGIRCNYNHPNSHLVTTSFYGSYFPYAFWNNGANAAQYKLYRDIDYADQHKYADEAFADPTEFYDSAQFSYNLSMASSFTTTTNTTRKPFIRGEAGWGFKLPRNSLDNPFSQNQEGGEWLHDYIWAGINPGGLMEQYFAGGYFTDHIYNIPKTGTAFDHRPMFGTFYRFIENIPLNNGKYQDANATASLADLRVWGQKDVTNNRAHLWIANKKHTWYNVMGGYTGGPAPVAITPLSGTVTLTGFTPGRVLPIEWWNTYTGQPETGLGQPSGSVTVDTSGVITLSVANLTNDAAVKIGQPAGSVTPTAAPTPQALIGDIEPPSGDNDVDFNDLRAFLGWFLTTNPLADFNHSGRVDIFDFSVLVNSFMN